MSVPVHKAPLASPELTTIQIVGRNGAIENMVVNSIQGSTDYVTSDSAGDSYIEFLVGNSLSGLLQLGPAQPGHGNFGSRTNRASRRKFAI